MVREKRPTNVRFAAKKPTVDELLASRRQLNAAGANFLKTDLQTALTFAGIALESEQGPKRDRNRGNARRGYDTIVRLIRKFDLSEEDVRFLARNLQRLKSELQTLGEVF